jgi:hypothetical protein
MGNATTLRPNITSHLMLELDFTLHTLMDLYIGNSHGLIVLKRALASCISVGFFLSFLTLYPVVALSYFAQIIDALTLLADIGHKRSRQEITSHVMVGLFEPLLDLTLLCYRLAIIPITLLLSGHQNVRFSAVLMNYTSGRTLWHYFHNFNIHYLERDTERLNWAIISATNLTLPMFC